MNINKSGAVLSRIVQIGENLKALSSVNGREYLPLNRGVNQVTNIDLTEVVKLIDFNSPTIQVYPHGEGIPSLRDAINTEFFMGKSTPDNILITAGGMHALDLIAQTVNIKKLYLPVYYWGCYYKMLKIRNVQSADYENQTELINKIDQLKDCAVLISDPSNPLGDKHDDEQQLEIIRFLNDNGVVFFFDCPYRRLFMDKKDDYYVRLMKMKNVIITESFSKSVGLSGQRLGFIHTTDKELYNELEVRIMYNTNGINGFAQDLVLKLLTTKEGIEAVNNFKSKTVNDIQLNINFLEKKGLLAKEFYDDTIPKGIFVIVNLNEEKLLEHFIGAVSLSFFTKTRQETVKEYSRICVSVPHEKFVSFFEKL